MVLFKHLKSQGIYVIEDLHTSYMGKFGGGFRKPKTTIEFLKGLIDEINFRGRDGSGDPSKLLNSPFVEQFELSYFEKTIESIHFYKSICFIFKR